MTRPALALVASLAATAPLAVLACGDAAGPGPAPSYEVTVTPRGPGGVPARFAGKHAGHVVARIPIDARQTMWRAMLTIRLMNASDAPVAVLTLFFPDTAVGYGRIELERLRGPFPGDRVVATGQVVRPDGVGLHEIESGQLELAQGPGGVVEGRFTARLVPIQAGGILEVVADAAGQFVTHRITW